MLKTRQELRELRERCRNRLEREKVKILVCSGTGCVATGAFEVHDAFLKALSDQQVVCSVNFMENEAGVGLKKTGCLGLCELGVMVRIEPEGYVYTKVTPADCAEIVSETIKNGRHVERLAYNRDGVAAKTREEIPFYRKQKRLVLEKCGRIDATSILEYIAADGYTALEKTLFEMEPGAVVAEVAESNLRGRGGGGFKTGHKWAQVRRRKAERKYIVCNGDEGDPGAFMDCGIMEGLPHQMLEGMMIAGRACGANEGYVYVRAEYPLAVSRLRHAIAEAEKYGLLGDDILGSGFNFRLHINRGAGAFVCGEGSALTASIEGKRGMPRVKPPRTVEHGLFNLPTVLNNVETFANVPIVINRGAREFMSIGPDNSPGTKAYSLTGNIANTGLIEVPMGATLREVIFDVGGGMRGGRKFKAVQIGGPSGACLTEEHFDLPLDFDSLKKAGAMIGSGGLVVADEDTCMVEIARFFMNFTQNESCGKCVPCREGTRRMLKILERIVAGEGREGDIDLLMDLADTIANTSLCGLGKTAASPVVSTIKNFRDEYEAHIRDKRCPARTCEKMKIFAIDPEACTGCSKCAKACPAGAISGRVKEAFFIDGKKCVKCGTCVTNCKFEAVKEGW